MTTPTKQHFVRAIKEIAAHGDNDTLPFDVDTKFFGTKADEIADVAFNFFKSLKTGELEKNHKRIAALEVFSERLVAPSGASGFRVVTKIQLFWCVYFNALAIAIAEKLESLRDAKVYSYRFLMTGEEKLFDPEKSWRLYKESTIEFAQRAGSSAVIVQTDISSFYEHVSHHHVENFITDLGGDGAKLGKQINALLNKFSAGRSFGLPVGGQGSRILAELFLKYVDDALNAAGIKWYRYVDDYVLVTESSAAAYKALNTLAQKLLNYGLTLNKSKTLLLSSKHYCDYVTAQLGDNDAEAAKLRSIDIKFDPYSDHPDEDYESLKETVESLEIRSLLNRELEKSLPDTFLISQIGRTVRLHEPSTAIEISALLLKAENLHAFRASWSTIMRGIANLRGDTRFTEIAERLDALLDEVPVHSAHLLEIDTNLLHYLRCLRFQATPARVGFISRVYNQSNLVTVKRMCIDIWRRWADRNAFTELRNQWQTLSPESQRLVWLSSYKFGDQGDGMRRQLKASAEASWQLGTELGSASGVPKFADVYMKWAEVSADAD